MNYYDIEEEAWREEFLWEGKSLNGLCGHCQQTVDNHDPRHRVTSILRGGRGVECQVRGDIEAHEVQPLGELVALEEK